MAGRGVNLKDEGEVKEYLENLGTEYRFGCYHEKNPKACHLLADYMEAIKKDYVKASKIYQTNCLELDYGHSCYKAAGYKFYGKGCDKDIEEGYDLFVKGCENGYARACFNAAVVDAQKEGTDFSKLYPTKKDGEIFRKRPPNPQRAQEFLLKACDGNIGKACQQASAKAWNGVPGISQPDKRRGFDLALKACDLGVAQSCANVSVMYRTGDGVDQNETLAKRFANIAKDIVRQSADDRRRTEFQQGAETAF